MCRSVKSNGNGIYAASCFVIYETHEEMFDNSCFMQVCFKQKRAITELSPIVSESYVVINIGARLTSMTAS